VSIRAGGATCGPRLRRPSASTRICPSTFRAAESSTGESGPDKAFAAASPTRNSEKAKSSRGVIVVGEDYKQIFWAMKRVSQRSGHDMAPGRNLPVPSPDEMKADLRVIDDYRTRIDKRRKATAEKRSASEEPPKAVTL